MKIILNLKIYEHMKKIITVSLIIITLVFSVFLILEFDSQKTYTNIASIGYRLKKFKEKCGRFPTSAEGLEVLNIKSDCYNFQNYGGLVVLKNGYGTSFIYQSKRDGFELISKAKFRDFSVNENDIE